MKSHIADAYYWWKKANEYLPVTSYYQDRMTVSWLYLMIGAGMPVWDIE